MFVDLYLGDVAASTLTGDLVSYKVFSPEFPCPHLSDKLAEEFWRVRLSYDVDVFLCDSVDEYRCERPGSKGMQM